MSIKCPQCQKNKAKNDREYGVIPCNSCQDENNSIPTPSQSRTYDFASSKTKSDRKEYGHDMYQPYSGDGVLSREYVETYGTDRLHGVTKKDIKNAKYVYGNMTRHHKMLENGVKKNKQISKPKDYYKVEGI